MNDFDTFHEAPEPAVPDSEEKAPFSEKFILFVVMFVVIFADQLAKNTVEALLLRGESWIPFPEITDILRITRVSNTGAAFGLFPSGSLLFMLVGVVVAIAIVLYNWRLPRHHVWYRIALGLQLGGALGNLIDRFRQQGHVTDFIDVGPVPVFNFADAAIVVGVILLLFLMLMDERSERTKKNAGDQSGESAETPAGESPEEHPMLWNE